MLEALPNSSVRYGIIACRTSGSSGVVAEWSRYTIGTNIRSPLRLWGRLRISLPIWGGQGGGCQEEEDCWRNGRQRTSSLIGPLKAFMYSWTSSISSLVIGPSSAAFGKPSGCFAFLSSSTATKLTPQLAQVTSTVQCPSASLRSFTWQSASAWEQARHL